ncbi:FecR domain-containing protein [candidate division WOR-3 bacterium]|nr:FecR domain-containing protein [candidate division WOR-3 bacterium]
MLILILLGTVLNVYTNDVVVKRADTTIIPTIGMELMDNDTVIAGDSSKAEILYADSSMLYLDANTRIATTSDEKKRSIFLSFGRIWAKVKKLVKGESLEVVTPVSISGITGTEFEQSFIAEKVDCKMFGGNLNFKDKKSGEEKKLGEGETASLEKGKAAKFGKFKKDQVKQWYKWTKGDADFVLGKLKQAYDDGEHGDGAAGKDLMLLASQVKAVAGKLGLEKEYESKLNELMKVKGTSMFEGLFAPTETGFLYAISSENLGRKTFILLKWPQMKGVKAFNLYRKEIPSPGIPTTPINSKPIAMMSNCNDIKAVIPEGSEEWQAITNVINGPPKPRTKRDIIKGSSTKGSSLIAPKEPASEMFAVPTVLAKLSPCAISTLSDTSKAYEDLHALAGKYWKVGVVIGQAYVDDDVVPGKKYMYAITPASSRKTGTGIGTEKIEAIDTAIVVAGKVLPLPAPSGVSTIEGDNKVMVRWNEMGTASGYDVYRSSASASPVKINGADIVEKCTLDLEGNKISEKNCFIDFMRWDEAGYPALHEVVAPDSIYGPYNGTTYQYKVRAYDALGRPGMFSSNVPATPEDETPPAVPYGITVEAYPDGLQPIWYQVTHDELGHVELSGIQGYKVYRFNSADSLADSTVVKSMLPDTFGAFPFFKDTDPSLFSAYGEKTYWYRVRSIDGAGNISGLSPSAGNNLPDTTPPEPPRNLKAESHADHIALDWDKPNPVPSDLAGYNIYRGVCGYDSVCVEFTYNERKEKICTKWELVPYPMHLVGNKDHPDSLKYKDYTVPPGSPICYRYTIKAYDKSQNLSDTSRTVCQKLREETPPAPPVLAGLKARDRAIKVEWVSSPVQDLFGFIVERAEKEAGPYKRVSDSLIFPTAIDCDDIPATNIWAADSVFSFIDTTVEEKKVYYYRVKAADYGGNIGKPSVPIETYTYNIGPPPTPTDLKVTKHSKLCALLIEWKPDYDKKYAGFVVFRSSDPNTGFRQISPILKESKFLDDKVIGNKDYYYKVQYFAKNGNRSLVSTAKNGKATP